MSKILGVLFVFLVSSNIALKAAEVLADGAPIEIEVYRSPSCGCCGKWIKHLQENNFVIKDFLTNDVQAIKEKYGVTNNIASCHTALVNGYVVEGHVPAADIIKMITKKPKIVGIAVPGMPVGTPGMNMGGRKDAYKVISFDADKNYQIVNTYKGIK